MFTMFILFVEFSLIKNACKMMFFSLFCRRDFHDRNQSLILQTRFCFTSTVVHKHIAS